MDTLLKFAMYASIAIACAIAVLNIIAPITKSDWDNKAVTFLRAVEDMIAKVLIPQLREAPAEAPKE